MIDTGAIRSKVLELAMQGKLSEQLPEDGTAEELYALIQEEKQKLIKEKKIKATKELPEIREDEIPFEIPDNWKWVRFNDIANIVGTGMIRSGQEQYDVADYYYFKMNNIENFTGKCDFGDMTMVNASDDEYKRYRIEEGDFLFNTRNSAELVGKTAVVHNLPSDKILLNNNILKVLFCGNISPDYINYFFISRSGRRQLEQFITSTTNVAAIYQRQIVTLAIPLPPLGEQKRITKKIEDIFNILDWIDCLQNSYVSNLGVLKTKIIDAGIQGKLTEQLPEDGTAEELLEQIRNKKDRMIKEGLIPKESASKKIGDEDMNFGIPQNWAYARVQDVATYITDYVANGSFATLKANTKTYKEPNYAVFVRTLDLGAKFRNELSYIDEESYEFLRKSKLYGGELILPNIGASIGKAFIMPDLGMPMSLAPNSVMVKFENNIMNKYFYYVFQSSYGKGILMNIQGGAATPKFSKTDLRKMIVMLPPLAEQERIVNRIEEIFALIQ